MIDKRQGSSRCANAHPDEASVTPHFLGGFTLPQLVSSAFCSPQTLYQQHLQLSVITFPLHSCHQDELFTFFIGVQQGVPLSIRWGFSKDQIVLRGCADYKHRRLWVSQHV